ncbi:MAG: glycerophosphoryl diester phosphodiesterase membrane domain-containing protein [Verrucomicrobia bacterium]|nr:glycerophosphoryl diester phosphodiesterase membrane domain-containing protein [Verrucomicrobiota bacterium]
MKTLSLKTCYALAWKSFSKWWIPLCLISAFILVFEVVPRIMLRPETAALEQKLLEGVSAFRSGTLEELEAVLFEARSIVWIYTIKLSKLLFALLPFIALLSMILLAWSNAAVKGRRNERSPGRMLTITGVHLLLTLVKGLAFAFFILPGFYLYIRLLFVTLIMLEENETGMMDAIRESWTLTRGNFRALLTLVCLNGTLQLVVSPTLIGLIPATGFANTARASAYQMLKR